MAALAKRISAPELDKVRAAVIAHAVRSRSYGIARKQAALLDDPTRLATLAPAGLALTRAPRMPSTSNACQRGGGAR
jgi:hypothetical protein